MQPENIAAPPWVLRGNGFVLIYHFPKEFSRKYGFLDSHQKSSLVGWVGAVIIADYTESPIGPYKELLFTPGIFQSKGRLRFSVSKAYVSNYDALWNGQNNWGIPKEQANFKIRENDNGAYTLEVGMQQKVFFHAKLHPAKFGFPFSSQLLPFFRLSQHFNDTHYRVRPRVQSRAHLSFIKDISASPDYFPPIHQLNPIAVLHLKNFKMRFPEARTRDIKIT